MTTVLSLVRLAEIRARIEAASKGPWRVKRVCLPGCEAACVIVATDDDFEVFNQEGALAEDAEFIAHARKDIEDLIAELTTLRASHDDNEALHADLARANERAAAITRQCAMNGACAELAAQKLAEEKKKKR